MFRVVVTEKPPCGRRFCVFRLHLPGGIYRYIFTVVGSASLKFSTARKTSDEGSATSSAANQCGGAPPFAFEVVGDRTGFHVVGVAVNGYGLEDEAEHGAALEAALRYGFNDSAQGLGSC